MALQIYCDSSEYKSRDGANKAFPIVHRGIFEMLVISHPKIRPTFDTNSRLMLLFRTLRLDGVKTLKNSNNFN